MIKFGFNLVMVIILLVMTVCGLTASAIWLLVKSFIRLGGIQLVGYKTHQEEFPPNGPAVPNVYVEFITEKEDFFRLKQAANQAGLWFVNVAWTPLGKTTSKFVYRILVREKP